MGGRYHPFHNGGKRKEGRQWGRDGKKSIVSRVHKNGPTSAGRTRYVSAKESFFQRRGDALGGNVEWKKARSHGTET